MSPVESANLLLGLVASVAVISTLWSMACLFWVTRRRRALADHRPPVTIFKPLKGTNKATFAFAPAAGGTKVTWAMDGRKNFITKGISLVMDMDKMIGTDFEAGLAALKAQAEADANANTGAASAN